MFSKKILFIVLASFFSELQAQDYANYVNPMIGASTDVKQAGAYHGLGKTFPGATTPFGMVQVSPQTITGGDNGSGYSDEMKTIEGFSLTQMSGVGWNGDLGNFTVMPTTGILKTSAGKEDGSMDGYRSRYDKSSEIAKAGYYSVKLTDYDILTECTATTRCGFLRFTFPQNEQSRIQIDLARRVGGTADEEQVIVVNDHTLEGYIKCTPDGGGWGDGAGKARYTLYYHAEFSKPFTNYGFYSAHIPEGTNRHLDSVVSPAYQRRIANAEIIRNSRELTGKHIGFYTEFASRHGEQVELKVGISYVDIEGARKNYQAEASFLNFQQACEKAHNQWNQSLAKVKVEGGTDEEKTIFYTALYHTMIDPRTYQDVDGRYTGGNQQTFQSDGFTKRTIFSGWDVYRSQIPLQTLINPVLVNDLINSLVTLADQSGNHYLERWELMNAYSGCMFGNPALSVIADAYAKGIRNFDTAKALEYGINTSEKFSNGERGYITGKGGSISYTLEYAYSDWCLGQFANQLGQKEIAQKYNKAGQAYKNIWDKSHGWFRPIDHDGTWVEWPEEGRLKEWYGTSECNPLQQGWFVPHDVKGMVKLMGGTEKVLKDLDWMFENTPENMFWNLYYNHANEPVHGVPYLYNRLGAPWKTQYWTRFICNHAYENKVAGLKGNEDVGQMSAWYVLSASGLHPYCPGETRMEITSPLFDEITFLLDNTYYQGGTFKIQAHNNSAQNVYIQKALLNGKPFSRCWLDFKDIADGGTLELFMGPEPNKKWGKN